MYEGSARTPRRLIRPEDTVMTSIRPLSGRRTVDHLLDHQHCSIINTARSSTLLDHQRCGRSVSRRHPRRLLPRPLYAVERATNRHRSGRRMLVGTWAAAEWAIDFYRRHGFEQVSPEQKNELLRIYWTVPDRQIETSVVLANPPIGATVVTTNDHHSDRSDYVDLLSAARPIQSLTNKQGATSRRSTICAKTPKHRAIESGRRRNGRSDGPKVTHSERGTCAADPC
jgi:hypothetical protein